MQRKTEVRTYRVNKICPICKQGDMVPTGMMLAANPPLHVHKCNMCGRQESYREFYPLISYEDVEEDINVLEKPEEKAEEVVEEVKENVQEDTVNQEQSCSEPSDKQILEADLRHVTGRMNDLRCEINHLDFKQRYNSEERDLMTRQLSAMGRYAEILKKRIENWREA